MLNKRSFPKDLINIVKTIKNSGFKCFVVGGGVRDLLLNKKVTNWDLTTDARPAQVTKLFKKVIPTGIDYGTVTVLIDKVPYEITTFRRDEKYVDGRHPSNVKFSDNLHDDLSRRDFTINAIAYDPLSGELVDEFGGQKDLKNKLIRTVGDPVDRFREDGLRPLRACRFAAKLNFKIDPKTLKAISKTLSVAKKVSVERVHDELMKMMEADKPSIGIDLMRRSGLLSLYIPELLEGVKVGQPKEYHKYDVYWHSLYSCDAAPKEKPILRFACLIHDIAKPACKVGMTFYEHDRVGVDMAVKVMRRLKFSNEHIEYVTRLIRNHMFNYTKDWSDSAVRRFIQRIGIDLVDDLFLLRTADMKAMGKKLENRHTVQLKKRIQKVLTEENALHIKDLKINGNDIMRALGIGPGPRIGEILNDVLERVVDEPKLNDKQKLMDLIKSLK